MANINIGNILLVEPESEGLKEADSKGGVADMADSARSSSSLAILKSRSTLAGLGEETKIEGLTPTGATYASAQAAAFVDEQHYVIGRADGTLSLYAFPAKLAQGPTMIAVTLTPAKQGIQAIIPLGTDPKGRFTQFVTSNDTASVVVWQSPSGKWNDLSVLQTLSYDPKMGVATCGTMVCWPEQEGKPVCNRLVLGHECGWVSIWHNNPTPNWTVVHMMPPSTVMPPKPSKYPWSNSVDGIAVIGPASPVVVTGSQDGNLTVIKVSDGTKLQTITHEPSALYGINNVAAMDGVLLVVNGVDTLAASNLWCYTYDPISGTLSDKPSDQTILRIPNKVDPDKKCFSFDVVFAGPRPAPPGTGDPAATSPKKFFCSTQQGLLWAGEVTSSGKLQPDSLQHDTTASAELGLALCVSFSGLKLAATAYDLRTYRIEA